MLSLLLITCGKFSSSQRPQNQVQRKLKVSVDRSDKRGANSLGRLRDNWRGHFIHLLLVDFSHCMASINYIIFLLLTAQFEE